ncbi:hypothetical protein RRG08_054430 [Elysia crispata]|uniref:Uncharacterized protein n=1 Tax=Elysia crispata TaxID=231223 RepID=A0AAE1E5B8_9GAST|nr:hypothetical protein RRG08_054430 [Elysia crispata]
MLRVQKVQSCFYNMLQTRCCFGCGSKEEGRLTDGKKGDGNNRPRCRRCKLVAVPIVHPPQPSRTNSAWTGLGKYRSTPAFCLGPGECRH